MREQARKLLGGKERWISSAQRAGTSQGVGAEVGL